MKLTNEEFDTLEWLNDRPEGCASSYDCYLYSIQKRILNDLKDNGLVRKKFFGWEITGKGVKKLNKY